VDDHPAQHAVWVGYITKLGKKKEKFFSREQKKIKIRKLGFSSSAVPSSLHVLLSSEQTTIILEETRAFMRSYFSLEQDLMQNQTMSSNMK
jgi:hypothetical protein